MSYVLRVTIVAALGGFLFGYDTAVIAGAIGFLTDKFQLTAELTGWAVSCALIGCMVGSFAAGPISDRIGRKYGLLLAAFLFFVSALGSAVPINLFWFCVARIVGGVGVGMASILSPMYIAEVAPAKDRGRLVTLNQLGIVVGILIVYFVNALIANPDNEIWNIQYGWRWMFASEAFPALLFIIGILFIPESPRWLVKKEFYDRASKTLHRIYKKTDVVLEEMSRIKKSITGANDVPWRSVFSQKYSYPLTIGIVLAVLSQVTGINAIMYYAPEIFKQSGLSSSAALYQTVAIGFINLIFTFVAIKFVDSIGRRLLLLIGATLMTFSLGLVGYAFQTPGFNGMLLLLFILCFIASFAMSFGPLTWVITAEIFPNQLRGKAMSISIFSLWIGVFLVSQAFPVIVTKFGTASTFYLFSSFSFLSLIFVYKYIPETKGRSLEEVESFWENHRTEIPLPIQTKTIKENK